MKQMFLSTACAMAFAIMAVGCAGDAADQGETGTVGLNVIIDGVDVTSVAFDVVCDSGVTLCGNLNVNDENDPPIATTIMALPPGACSVSLTASNEQGEVLCTGSTDFTVIVDQTVEANVVLLCGEPGVDPVGNVNITGTFEFVPGNRCPRLYFLNAVPDEVPAEGSEVTVLTEDADGDVLTTALTATGGSFADPSAQLTTYFCDNASGAQTISVTVTDGDAACDKSKSFDVTCPGVNLCEGVTCDDTGNECTTAECNPETGLCEESDLDGNECTAGGGGELANNGGFETGDLTGWTPFCEGLGTCEATTAESNTGDWSGLVLTAGAPANPLIKQANVGIGVVQPNSEITIRFSMKGSLAGASGVVFAELFSEIVPEGVSQAEILGGGPLFPTDQWVDYEFTTTTGPDVSNGVTLQLAAICGAVEGCVVEAYFDDVSIVIPGGGGEPGTCNAGMCVPNEVDLCEGNTCDDEDTECSDSSCDAGTGQCVATPINEGGACEGGAGTCNAGVCEPNAEVVYEQNFEQLDIAGGVIGDSWFFFNNVFDAGDNLLFSYNNPLQLAPNATIDPDNIFISALVDDQGNGEQGTQQLSVFSDYNCCQPSSGHINGTDKVEVNVLRDVFTAGDPIAAGDIGKTVTFAFQAKRGNIEAPTTALGYIKTLDPSANFAQTNFVIAETTNVGTDWTPLTVSLPLTDAALVGQVLQIGFQNTASDFASSGVFYDNVVVTLE